METEALKAIICFFIIITFCIHYIMVYSCGVFSELVNKAGIKNLKITTNY